MGRWVDGWMEAASTDHEEWREKVKCCTEPRQ